MFASIPVMALALGLLGFASADSFKVNNINQPNAEGESNWFYDMTFTDGDGTNFYTNCDPGQNGKSIFDPGCNGKWQDSKPQGIKGGYILNVNECDGLFCTPQVMITSFNGKYGPACCTPTSDIWGNDFSCTLGPC